MAYDHANHEDDDIFLQTRPKPESDGETSVKVWDSTYKKLVKIKGKMEGSSGETTSLPQVIDALARAVERTKIQVVSDD